MSEFIQKNKFLVHVCTEVSCLCLLVLYMVKNNNSIYKHMKYLEQKLNHYDNVLEKHDQLLTALLNKKVSFKEQPVQVRKPTPQSKPATPPPQQSAVSYDDDEEIIETPSIEDDNLDEEIQEELNKLQLSKNI